MATSSNAAARISHDAAQDSIALEQSDATARISHDAAAQKPGDAKARASHDAEASAEVVVQMDAVKARISHDAALGANPPVARISHDAAASADTTLRISHDVAASSAQPAAPPPSRIAAVVNLVTGFVRRPWMRRSVALVKALGISSVVLAGAQQLTTTYAPQWADPVAEFLHLRKSFAAVTLEPGEQPPGQGKITATESFKYEFRLSNLNDGGIIRGRFRGYAKDGKADPRWWYVSGRSDGKRAMLTYHNENGVVLGQLSLTLSKDKALWAGYLTGIDRSISDTGFVQSAIIVAQSDYDIARVKSDSFLKTRPFLINGYTK
ncbi:hypothetical protein [Bradyrhizobium centrosematis]|uniref:hypothetical protein n=1 Tax=Bradyrhizobium centrosematis TaxID=1300039 RepID=UPI0021687B83|nr:hypothetical protein [Bradyrhizobium centrosematis]MCS3761640.1 hypothetical protein [Bradyrhizobium centrosematis]MCS3774308.1 hypothetical protein [Bradyrhizobium centrosematis]